MYLKLKRDMVYFFLFLFLFVLMTHDGIVKYLVLSGMMVFFFLLKGKVRIEYFVVAIHAVVYVVWGVTMAVLSNNFTFNSVKQTLIFLSAAFLAVAIFSIYGKEGSSRLVDVQFVALCVAYLLMYARYFTPEAFYYESCFYAYIFGVYILIYFMRKRYFLMIIAIMFMGICGAIMGTIAALIYRSVVTIYFSNKKVLKK